MTNLKNCRIVLMGHGRSDWSLKQIKGWIETMKGCLQKSVCSDTTHLVLDADTWKAKDPVVLEALEQGNVKVVSFDWLEDTLMHTKKEKESLYLWQKLNRSAKSTKKGLSAVFHDSTDGYVNAREVERSQQIQRAKDAQQNAIRDRERETIKSIIEGKKEQAALLSKGARQAKETMFSANHHIYVGIDGLMYKILLTKVDTQKNRNERITLTIYESNALPSTYALNVQYAASGIAAQNDLIVAIGSNFESVWRMFKKIFMEKTQVSWDERFAFSAYREEFGKMQRAAAEGKDVEAATFGSDSAHVPWNSILQDRSFADSPFSYYPPPMPEQVSSNSDEVASVNVKKPEASSDSAPNMFEIFGQNDHAEDGDGYDQDCSNGNLSFYPFACPPPIVPGCNEASGASVNGNNPGSEHQSELPPDDVMTNIFEDLLGQTEDTTQDFLNADNMSGGMYEDVVATNSSGKRGIGELDEVDAVPAAKRFKAL